MSFVRWRVLSLPLVLIFAALGCKGANPNEKLSAERSEAPSALEPGWKEVTTSGVSISFPPGLEPMDLTRGGIEKMAQRIEKLHPDRPELAASVRKMANQSQIKLMATEAKPDPDGVRDNANLIVLDLRAGTSVDDVLSRTLTRLERLSVRGTISGVKVDLPAGPAARIENRVQSTSALFSHVEYALVHDGKEYQVTFTSGATNEASWRQTAEKIMRTLRFKG